MGTCVHFSRSLPSNSWWQTMAGWEALSRPPPAEGGGRRPAFTGLATQPYSATEVDGWQHKLSRVSQNRAAVHDLDQTHVSFRWKDYRENGIHKSKVMRIEVAEFIRRFLLHILPSGFHRIRHYGLVANGHRADKLAL